MLIIDEAFSVLVW